MTEQTDYLLRFTYPASRDDIDERIQGAIFLSSASGSAARIIGETATCSIYFASAEARSEARPLFGGIEELDLEEIDEPRLDWLERYQQSLHPIPIGRRWVVIPAETMASDDESRIALVVPQERAFGTGSHESTALCLAMIERVAAGGGTCLDIGTGTGILAIAMRKLGSSRVIAFDNDFESMPIFLENLGRNGIAASEVAHFCGTADALRGVAGDVVTMNILPEVIIPSLPLVRTLVAPNGRLILSGIIEGWRDAVVDAATANALRLLEEERSGEWWCGVFGIAT